MIEDVKLFENKQCFFYVNDWTRGAEDYAKACGLNIKCLHAVQKDNSKDEIYILIENNEIIYEQGSYEGLGCYIDMIALSRGK